MSDPVDVPWPEIDLGFVLGGAAYGIFAIANKPAPSADLSPSQTR